MSDAYMEEETCPDCLGEGIKVVCCDDICVGQGWCMHGEDGDEVCGTCDGEGFIFVPVKDS